MGILDGKKESEEKLYEEASKLEIQEEVTDRRSRIAQREAVIKELKREYGPDWKKTLGISSLMDVESLKSFLSSAKVSMSRAGNPVSNPAISPVMPGNSKLAQHKPGNPNISPLPPSSARFKIS